MSKRIGTPLVLGIILIISVDYLASQTYFYDAKYLGYQIILEPTNNEILVKFRDSITEQKVITLAQDKQLDIRSMDLDNLKYARLQFQQSHIYNEILSYIRKHPDVKAAMPVLIDQFGARRKFIPGQFTVQHKGRMCTRAGVKLVFRSLGYQ